MSKAFILFPIPMQPPNQVILDTGPLVLLVLSRFYAGTASVLNDRLVRNYTQDQLNRLETALERAHNVILSPYCLAESTNLIRRSDQRRVLAHIAAGFETRWGDVIEILQDSRFPRLGVADVSLLLLAKQPDTYTLTADRDLYDALSTARCTLIYFCVEPGSQYILDYP